MPNSEDEQDNFYRDLQSLASLMPLTDSKPRSPREARREARRQAARKQAASDPWSDPGAVPSEPGRELTVRGRGGGAVQTTVATDAEKRREADNLFAAEDHDYHAFADHDRRLREAEVDDDPWSEPGAVPAETGPVWVLYPDGAEIAGEVTGEGVKVKASFTGEFGWVSTDMVAWLRFRRRASDA